ncbi:MAG TPA: amino acid adenylation domain-containing protein, partial [Blastocatellia bacterium]
VQELRPDRNISYNPLFQVSLELQSARLPELNLGRAVLEPQVFKSSHTTLDLEVRVWDHQDRILGQVTYSTDLFDGTTIQRMSSHFQNALRAAVVDPLVRVSRIDLLSAVESHHIVSEWNAACLNYSIDEGVHQLVEEHAGERPDAAAVYSDGNVLSYGEMNRRANQLAHWLRAEGVGPESVVAIVMKRSTDWMVAMLGALKAGAGYACFDPANPRARIKTMMTDCGAPVLLTQTEIAMEGEPQGPIVINIDGDWDRVSAYSDKNPTNVANDQNVAYVVYTSGSTGKPKGVVTSHGALLNLVYWHRSCWNVVAEDKGSQIAQSGFDAAVWEIWPYLTAGAALSIADRYSRLAADKLCDWLIENEITIGWLPPVLAEPLLLLPQIDQLKMRVLFSGADRLLLRPPVSAPFVYINIYGPTEAAAITTFGYVASEGQEPGAPDIGRPVYNDQIYILDRSFRPNPIGAPGQLCIGGKSLARGYLGSPELTAEKFGPHPMGDQGSRMYKTGDLARVRADGRIDFIARIDHQVKIRGFRIELGEVESALLESGFVSEAVVIGSQGSGPNKQLIAYVVPETQAAATGGLEGLEENLVARWRSLYDETYGASEAGDVEFDITGWNSSYTGMPIPAEEMREWQESTIAVIQEAPLHRRVLEVGSGTGLLLYRLAKKCEEYWGTDFSAVTIGRLRGHIERSGNEFRNVKLLERPADDFEGIPEGYFDLVVINSVIQYFPGWEYLDRVIAGALKCTKHGGVVFVGDVRNLEMLEALRTSVEIYNSPDDLSTEEVRKRIGRRIEREEELVVSPEYFLGLPGRLDGIAGVEIRLKRGRAHNELTKYRYDVVVHVGQTTTAITPELVLDWQEEGLSAKRLSVLLDDEKPSSAVVRNIPNQRVAKDLKAVEVIECGEGPATVAAIRESSEANSQGIDPESISSIDDQYKAKLFWSSANRGGSFDLLFTRKDVELSETKVDGMTCTEPLMVWNTRSAGQSNAREPELCTNRPVRADMAGELVPKLKAYLSQRTPEYMVPSAFVVLDRLPRNSNGKVDRKSLPVVSEVRRDGDETYVKPRTPDQEMLASMWARLLGVDQIGIEDNFFDLGGHSLLATQIVNAIRNTFKIELPLVEFFTDPTIAALAAKIASSRAPEKAMPGITAAVRGLRAPLSWAQQRLWFLEQLDSSSAAYHVPSAFRVIGPLRFAVFTQALREMARRHEALRTTFDLDSGQPMQIVSDCRIDLEMVDLSNRDASAREPVVEELVKQAAIRPFDLSVGPLLRAILLRIAPQEHVIAVVLHHIISDGWSLGVIVSELSALYDAFSNGGASALNELAIQYADFAIWQRQWLSGKALDEQLSFWKKQLKGAPDTTALPFDRPRPAIRSDAGGLLPVALDLSVDQGLKKICQDKGATLFMGLVASLQVLLSRYSGHLDIVVGSPIANRNHTEIEDLIGFFVNMLLLRSDLSSDPPLGEFLSTVRETALAAYAHQDLPFERMVEEMNLGRDIAHNPLFQVSIAVQNMPLGDLDLGGLVLRPQAFEDTGARFDLEFG